MTREAGCSLSKMARGFREPRGAKIIQRLLIFTRNQKKKKKKKGRGQLFLPAPSPIRERALPFHAQMQAVMSLGALIAYKFSP